MLRALFIPVEAVKVYLVLWKLYLSALLVLSIFKLRYRIKAEYYFVGEKRVLVFDLVWLHLDFICFG